MIFWIHHRALLRVAINHSNQIGIILYIATKTENRRGQKEQ